MTAEARAETTARTMKATEFEANCLELIDEVAETGEEIVITRNGKPVSKLAPYRDRPRTLFGIDRGRFEIVGDVVSPTGAVWDAEQGLIDGE